jgi:membrane-associated protease RseP (regulator of RpoE activity)
MMTLGVLAFVVALLVSVMLHEAGHFLTAKLFKMKATQFFVGFGPTLWSRKRGETEYGVKAIPAGGFVKIVGMTPLEEIAPEDRSRAFINHSGFQRFVVLVAGSTVHFIIAIVLLFALSWGWPSHDTGYAKIDAVAACVTPSPTTGLCPAGSTAPPAAGVLQAGDQLIAIDGKNVATTPVRLIDTSGSTTFNQIVTGGSDGATGLIRAAKGPVTLTIKRHGQPMTVSLTPTLVDGVPHIGVSTDDVFARVGPIAAAGTAFSTFGSGVVQSFAALGHVPSELRNVLNTHDKRQLDNSGGKVTSLVGVARLSGQGFAEGGFSSGLAFLIGVIASVNLFVGIFNLFPFLPLDGGHVAILLYEKVRDRWRRFRKLPVAGVVDLNKLMPLTYGVLVLVVGVSALLLFADVVNPVANPFHQ